MSRAGLLVLTLSILVAAPAAAQRRVPDLSGSWALRDSSAASPSASRDTVSADSTAADSAALGDSTIGPPAPPGTSRPPRAPRRSAKDLRQIQLLHGMAQPVPAITLAQTDSTLVVTNDDGFTYTVYLDGRKTTLPLSDSVSVEVKAKWDDGALVIEYRPTGGGVLTESYHLADSGLYLRVDVTVEHRAMRPVWDPRMYRRSGGS